MEILRNARSEKVYVTRDREIAFRIFIVLFHRRYVKPKGDEKKMVFSYLPAQNNSLHD